MGPSLGYRTRERWFWSKISNFNTRLILQVREKILPLQMASFIYRDHATFTFFFFFNDVPVSIYIYIYISCSHNHSVVEEGRGRCM